LLSSYITEWLKYIIFFMVCAIYFRKAVGVDRDIA
jgi:hypothetical protein